MNKLKRIGAFLMALLMTTSIIFAYHTIETHAEDVIVTPNVTYFTVSPNIWGTQIKTDVRTKGVPSNAKIIGAYIYQLYQTGYCNEQAWVAGQVYTSMNGYINTTSGTDCGWYQVSPGIGGESISVTIAVVWVYPGQTVLMGTTGSYTAANLYQVTPGLQQPSYSNGTGKSTITHAFINSGSYTSSSPWGDTWCSSTITASCNASTVYTSYSSSNGRKQNYSVTGMTYFYAPTKSYASWKLDKVWTNSTENIIFDLYSQGAGFDSKSKWFLFQGKDANATGEWVCATGGYPVEINSNGRYYYKIKQANGTIEQFYADVNNFDFEPPTGTINKTASVVSCSATDNLSGVAAYSFITYQNYIKYQNGEYTPTWQTSNSTSNTDKATAWVCLIKDRAGNIGATIDTNVGVLVTINPNGGTYAGSSGKSTYAVHVHNGSTTHIGECYKYTFHNHSGNSTSGGGCYSTPVYKEHTHTDACYKVTQTTCQITVIEGNGTRHPAAWNWTWCGQCDGYSFKYGVEEHHSIGNAQCQNYHSANDNMQYIGSGANSYWNYPGSCAREYAEWQLNSPRYGSHTVTDKVLICGKTSGQRYETDGIDHYELGCEYKNYSSGQQVDGNIVSAAMVCELSTKQYLETPVREGYVFAGWVSSNNYEAKYDEETKQYYWEGDESTTLTAKWRVITKYIIKHYIQDEETDNYKLDYTEIKSDPEYPIDIEKFKREYDIYEYSHGTLNYSTVDINEGSVEESTAPAGSVVVNDYNQKVKATNSQKVYITKSGLYKIAVAGSPGQYSYARHACYEVSADPSKYYCKLIDGRNLPPQIAYFSEGGTGDIYEAVVYLEAGTTVELGGNTSKGSSGGSWRYVGYEYNWYIDAYGGTGGSGSSIKIDGKTILSAKGGNGAVSPYGAQSCGYLANSRVYTPTLSGGTGGGTTYMATDTEMKSVGAMWLSESAHLTQSAIKVIDSSAYNSGYASIEYLSTTLSIDPDGGTYEGKTTIQSKEVKSGETVTLSTPVKSNCTFDGWRIVYGNECVVQGNSITMGSTSVILQAIWKTEDIVDREYGYVSLYYDYLGYYYVEYNKGLTNNGGKTETTMHQYTQDVTLAENGFVGMDYSIKYDANKPSNAKGNVENIPSNVSGKLEFGRWKVNSTENSGEYDAGVNLGPKNFERGGNKVATATALWLPEKVTIEGTPTLQDWVFLGWSEDKNATTGSLIINVDIEPSTTAFSKTYYAIWGTKDYTISYVATGASNVPETQIKKTDIDIKISSSIPVKEYYKFNSWNTKEDGTGVKYSPSQVYAKNEDLVLYAIWNTTTDSVYYLKGLTNDTEHTDIAKATRNSNIQHRLVAEKPYTYWKIGSDIHIATIGTVLGRHYEVEFEYNLPDNVTVEQKATVEIVGYANDEKGKTTYHLDNYLDFTGWKQIGSGLLPTNPLPDTEYEPLYKAHKHQGSASSGGGCYTRAVRHYHTESCHHRWTTPVYCGQHNADGATRWEHCYGSCRMICGGQACGDNSCTQYAHYYEPTAWCPHRGTVIGSFYCGVKTGDEPHDEIICGMSDGQILYYELTCGRVEGVRYKSEGIERYVVKGSVADTGKSR